MAFDYNSLLYALMAAKGMGAGSPPSMQRPAGTEGPLMQSGDFYSQQQPQQQQTPFLPMPMGGGGEGGGVSGGLAGAGQGAASGATAGMMFGAWGAAIGGLIGAAMGGIQGSNKPPTPAPPPAQIQEKPKTQLKPTAGAFLSDSLMNANRTPTSLPPQMSLEEIKRLYGMV